MIVNTVEELQRNYSRREIERANNARRQLTEYNHPVHTFLADNKFAMSKEDMEYLGICVNVASKNKHVPEVDRQIRVIKERARGVVQTLPFSNMPKKMFVAMINYVVLWLNLLPKTGQDNSPRDIILGEEKINYKTMCQLLFGAYAQVHDDLDITNTMESRITGAINLGPTGNLQGTHRFLSLKTGELIVQRKWTELPVPSDAIDRLEELAGDVSNVLDRLEEKNDQENLPELINAEEQPELELENDQQNLQVHAGNKEVKLHNAETSEEIYNKDLTHHDVKFQDEPKEDVDDVVPESELIPTDNFNHHEEKENMVNNRYNLRINRGRDYSHRFTLLSVSAGIKHWGDKTKEALMDELKLFLKEEVFDLVNKPTKEQKKLALPTIKLESIMLGSLIDAFEQIVLWISRIPF